MAEIGTAYVKVQPVFGEPSLASQIVIRQKGETFSMLIDGQEFPWFISEEGPTIEASVDDMPRVTVTIIAKTVKTNAVG